MQAVAPRPAGFCGTPTRNIPKAALEKLAAVDKANAENVPAAPVPVFTGKSPSTGKKQAATTPQSRRASAGSAKSTPGPVGGRTPTVTITGRSEALEMLGEYESVEKSFQVAHPPHAARRAELSERRDTPEMGTPEMGTPEMTPVCLF